MVRLETRQTQTQLEHKTSQYIMSCATYSINRYNNLTSQPPRLAVRSIQREAYNNICRAERGAT